MRQLSLLITVLAILISCDSRTLKQDGEVWPDKEWILSTPEARGVNSEPLAEMLESIQTRELDIDSVQVIRKGSLILDAFLHPYGPSDTHIIHSCTKSIMSLLIGIAIDRGEIEGVDQSVLDFLPTRDVAGKEWEELTIRHLLTMTTGLQSRDSYLYDWKGLAAMMESPEPWSSYILQLPFEAEAGSRFDYSNMASYLLSVILTEATGMKALDYASLHLFEPLGMGEVLWPESPEGYNIGWGEIRIHPHDLCRIGLLVARSGEWKGRRIVSEAYLAQAVSAQHRADSLSDSYGFQWWVSEEGLIMALGYGGQYLIIDPERELVVVFTSALKGKDFSLPLRLYNQYILKAVESDSPLEENPRAHKRLITLSQVGANPEPKTPEELPEGLRAFDGLTYMLDENGYGMRSFCLRFEDRGAVIDLDFGEGLESYRIGWDGGYAFQEELGVAVKALSSSDRKLEAKFKGIGEAWWFRLKAVFYEDGIHLVLRSSSGDYLSMEGERRD